MKRTVPSYNSGTGAGKRVLQVTTDRFGGGLALTPNPMFGNSDQAEDALDVDFPRVGGVSRRKAIGAPTPSNAPTGVYDGLWTYDRGASGVQVLYGVRSTTNTLIYEFGAPTTVIKTVLACSPKSVTMNNKCYTVYGSVAAPTSWNGTAFTNLTQVLSDNSLSLPHGSMPKAKCIAVHQKSAWVANLIDPADGISYPNRVRWSWPDNPEDWPSWAKENVDVGSSSDEIVALVPFGERLLVFKRKSVYAITGRGPDGYNLVPLSQSVGAVSPEAVVRTDEAVYFFDSVSGLYRIGPSGFPEYVFANMQETLDNGSIVPSAVSLVSVSWVGRRVYVSVPWLSAAQGTTFNARTLIYDYTSRAWTIHNYGMGQAVQVRPNSDTVYSLAPVAHPSAPTFQKLGILGGPGDSDWNTFVITGLYQSAWMDAGDPMLDKRWRRLGLIFAGTAQMTVQPRLNYSSISAGSFVLQPPSGTGTNLWGTGLWGTAIWTADFGSLYRQEDGKPVGVGRTISVVITNTTAGTWNIAAMNAKYIPRRRRD